MTVEEILEQWIAGFETNNVDAAAALISDESFSFIATNLPQPLAKVEWVGFIKTLGSAAPDIQSNWSKSTSTENALDYHLHGTHTDTLVLAPLGLSDFKASGKSFNLPVDTYVFTAENGMIVQIDVDPAPGAGLGGILAQLELV